MIKNMMMIPVLLSVILTNYRIGLVVDLVKDVITVSEDNIQSSEDILKDRKNDFISKIIDLDDNYILAFRFNKNSRHREFQDMDFLDGMHLDVLKEIGKYRCWKCRYPPYPGC